MNINNTVDEYKINGDIERPQSPTFSINGQLLFETLKVQNRVKPYLMQHGRKKSNIRLNLRKFKVALNSTYRIFLNFAKSCVLSRLSKVDNIKKIHCGVFEL